MRLIFKMLLVECLFNIQLMRDPKAYLLIPKCGSKSQRDYVIVKFIRDI